MTCDVFPEFYSWSEPVAARQHDCVECFAPILKGEKHFRAVGKWEGQFDVHRQHLLCCEACMLVRDGFNDGECIAFGDLMEAFGEMRPHPWLRNDRHKESWQRLRDLMAKIFRRERPHKRKSRAALGTNHNQEGVA